MKQLKSPLFLEFVVRIALLAIFCILEHAKPFQRSIHPEELWRYKNQVLPDTISSAIVVVSKKNYAIMLLLIESSAFQSVFL